MAYFYAEKEDISNMAELSRPIDKEFNVDKLIGYLKQQFKAQDLKKYLCFLYFTYIMYVK